MGLRAWISACGTVQESTTEKAFCSRMRRAMSWVYCEPKIEIEDDNCLGVHVPVWRAGCKELLLRY